MSSMEEIIADFVKPRSTTSYGGSSLSAMVDSRMLDQQVSSVKYDVANTLKKMYSQLQQDQIQESGRISDLEIKIEYLLSSKEEMSQQLEEQRNYHKMKVLQMEKDIHRLQIENQQFKQILRELLNAISKPTE